MVDLRIFSYLPNPRVMKAAIAARALGVDIEIVGDSGKNLSNWLWDVNPRLLEEDERTADSPHIRHGKRGFDSALYKTDAFLACHPFGTVPAAFSPDGQIGIFESNSILRTVARLGKGLYGRDEYESSRIDSFLDANLVFAREFQAYLFALAGNELDAALHERMRDAYEFYVAGIDAAIGDEDFLVGGCLSIADISFACDFAQFDRERYYSKELAKLGLVSLRETLADTYPSAERYHLALLKHSDIAPDLGPYVAELASKLAAR
jgi:elongation factor 1-gamma